MDSGQRRAWPFDRAKIGVSLLSILTLIAVIWLLQVTSSIFIPMTAAFFVAVGVAPVSRWVQDRVPARVGWLGYAAAMLVILALIAAFVGSLWFVAQSVAAQFPQYADEFQKLLADAQAWVNGTKQDILGDAAGAQGAQPAAGVDPVTSVALAVLDSLRHTALTLALIVFLALLMLVEAPVWREKVANTLGRDSVAEAMDAVTAIAQKFRQYLVVSSLLGILTGVLYVLWLWPFGLDFIFLWGFLAFLLNYIPLAGSLIAGALPVMMAVLQKDPGTALIVAGGILVIEQVMGNLVAPWVQGKQLSISPLVIMFQLMLWSWLWGVAGALLAAPMAVMIAIAMTHIDGLRPFAVYFSDKSDVKDFEESTRAE